MENTSSGKSAVAFGWSYAVTGVLSALLVVLKESNEAVMAWMKNATGHHWVTHGVITLALFLVLGFVLRGPAAGVLGKTGYDGTAIAVAVSTIISGLIIAGFFL